ncbi:hypothetical protein BJ508DRAFT_109060 [Ascobolus immersus RN42]|uniref:Glycosyltransferase family 69 protein n=1 Tax=Ascobolus immersus RN42 TaxID=1160509 RepID=A0A3N4H8W0_ASCIM|nr:hypothetical protein BJ508DRAFT_109060 [Ascobolus immersus RN42]
MRSRRLLRRTLIFTAITVAIWLHLRSTTTTTTSSPHRPNPTTPDTLPHPGRVFIASNHWNSAPILPLWLASIKTLILALGPSNVFFSTSSNGSRDKTPALLREFEAWLVEHGVAHRIEITSETHADLIADGAGKDAGNGYGEDQGKPGSGWVWTSRKRWERRRIPYLAGLRNGVLGPLWDGTAGGGWERVLFLNDVIFEAEDAMRLLGTNNGSYAAACALDFSKPHRLYDTFATRDSNGNPPATGHFPYFFPSASRDVLLHPELSRNIIPVKSCWNGMVAFDAGPFLPARDGMLRFRGTDDSLAQKRVEASECCLIHADNPLSRSKGVFINAGVKVAYNKKAWAGIKSGAGEKVGWGEWLDGMWKNWVGPRGSGVMGRMREWVDDGVELREERREEGVGCLVEEMQVLVRNGWVHV